jgi:multimeric flavodoxin WrbA
MSDNGRKRAVIVNGGPRKKWNTATLLDKAREGVESVGAETSLVHLYELTYKGCVSCMACKTAKGWREGRCHQKDGLSPVLESLAGADVVILGSPIYVSDVTGALRGLMERWIFINLAYDPERPRILAKGPAVGVIYTMNVPENRLAEMGYPTMFAGHKYFLEYLNGPAVEQLLCCDTLQFEDYSKFHAPAFDEAKKRRIREERFPMAMREAFEMGARLASL